VLGATPLRPPLSNGAVVAYSMDFRLRRGKAADRATTRPQRVERETTMTWTTPILVEICIGLEINGYLPAEL